MTPEREMHDEVVNAPKNADQRQSALQDPVAEDDREA